MPGYADAEQSVRHVDRLKWPGAAALAKSQGSTPRKLWKGRVPLPASGGEHATGKKRSIAHRGQGHARCRLRLLIRRPPGSSASECYVTATDAYLLPQGQAEDGLRCGWKHSRYCRPPRSPPAGCVSTLEGAPGVCRKSPRWRCSVALGDWQDKTLVQANMPPHYSNTRSQLSAKVKLLVSSTLSEVQS